MIVINNFVARVIVFLFYDVVRQVEIMSACSLIAWAVVFYKNPALLERDTYLQFQSLGASTWVSIFVAVVVSQVAGMASNWPRVRFIAMACASGCWAAITAAFLSSEIITTAIANYALFFTLTAISGGYLGWKTS